MKVSGVIEKIGKVLIEAVYPSVCEVCGRRLVEGETMMCLHCLMSMPRTKIHSDQFNTLHQRLASPGVPIERAGSYFYYFRENPYARLIHAAKYNSRPGIARRLGEWYADEISADGFFDGIDVILPVPLHRFKLISRGYNQSEQIALGLSKVTGIPVGDNLRAARHSTQTRKNAFERMVNVAGIMSVVHGDELVGKHVMIVDDVITTGATMLACVMALHRSVPGIRTSVISIGATKLN